MIFFIKEISPEKQSAYTRRPVVKTILWAASQKMSRIFPVKQGQKRGDMNQSYLKKYLLFILSFLLTASLIFSTGCSRKSEEKETESASVSLVEKDTTKNNSTGNKNDTEDEDSKPVDTGSTKSLFEFSLYDNDMVYSKEDLTAQQNFEDFLNKVFTDEYSMSSLSLNFLIENPESYGISRVPSAWPAVDISGMDEYFTGIQEYLTDLNTFQYDSLTYEQKLIYDILKTYLEAESTYENCYLFTSPFSTDGITSQLPIIFAEYIFHNKQDVEEYINLLETLQNYVKDSLEYEQHRIEKGYYLSGYTYETVIAQCQAFLDQGENYLTDIFKNKLDEMKDITAEEKEAYIRKNEDAIQTSVIPAYRLMIDTLTELQKKGEFNKGLCEMEHGEDFYKYLLKTSVGTDKTPEELISFTDANLKQYQAQMTSLILTDASLYDKIEKPEYIYSDPDEILSHLTKMLKTDFPDAVCDSYNLHETDAAMSDELVVAFYILSPIDHFQNNVIYINPDKIAEGSDLFPTLAHEGIPGHMYQHNYFCNLKPHYFRSILTNTGYSEGWAKYVELYSYNWSGLDENLAKLLKINDLFSIALPTRIDLGINYEGWSVEDTADYLSQFGMNDKETVKLYYDTIISSPTVFLPYYIGYLELETLKDTAAQTLGDKFSIRDFHKFYLEIGPAYFNIISDRMNDWLEKMKNL